MRKIIEKFPLPLLVVLCLTLGLAPFSPEPHLLEKLKMLTAGELARPVDIFDLLMHGAPWALLVFKLYSLTAKTRHSGALNHHGETMTEIRSNESVLCEQIELKGLRIVDIGSGAGELVRFMTGKGAQVTGLECGALQLEKARSYAPEGDEIYVEGFGQELPFADASFDAVVFFNSLHHVPVEYMATAVAEAMRVVRVSGTIYVAEPIARGSGFELHAPIDDESSVRDAAYAAVRGATTQGLTEVREIFYDTIYHYENFETFKEEMIRIEPSRRAPFEANEAELKKSFARLGVPEEQGVRFDQPMRINILEKT